MSEILKQIHSIISLLIYNFRLQQTKGWRECAFGDFLLSKRSVKLLRFDRPTKKRAVPPFLIRGCCAFGRWAELKNMFEYGNFMMCASLKGEPTLGFCRLASKTSKTVVLASLC
jgi:hypothetical protein